MPGTSFGKKEHTPEIYSFDRQLEKFGYALDDAIFYILAVMKRANIIISDEDFPIPIDKNIAKRLVDSICFTNEFGQAQYFALGRTNDLKHVDYAPHFRLYLILNALNSFQIAIGHMSPAQVEFLMRNRLPSGLLRALSGIRSQGGKLQSSHIEALVAALFPSAFLDCMLLKKWILFVPIANKAMDNPNLASFAELLVLSHNNMNEVANFIPANIRENLDWFEQLQVFTRQIPLFMNENIIERKECYFNLPMREETKSQIEKFRLEVTVANRAA